MMNWRTIMGLVFLLAGMMKLYSIIATNGGARLSGPAMYAEVGCVVWVGVGIFLVIKGVNKNAR